jgi:hypothetical protein
MRPRGEVGIHATGTQNTSTYFANGSYLELLAVHDRSKVAEHRPHFLEFLEKHEGASIVALSTSSAETTSRLLTARGFPVSEPSPGSVQRPTDKEMPPPKWWTVRFNDAAARPAPLFFIQYVETDYDDMFENWDEGYSEVKKFPDYRHPNTALGISEIWLAVNDLNAAAKAYQQMGFKVGADSIAPSFNAKVREIEVVRQRILLLQPMDATGIVASFLESRGEGVLGVGIEVENLESARALISGNIKRRMEIVPGLRGQDSVLVPAAAAHGVWLQFQQEEARRP